MASMDERHWWFSSKLQEAFKFGGKDVPTLLEDFMCEDETMQLIEEFLRGAAVHRLFFFCHEREACANDEFSGGRRVLHVASAPPPGHAPADQSCLYFLRAPDGSGGDLGVRELPERVLCGYVRFSTLQQFSAVLDELIGAAVHSQRRWRDCPSTADKDVFAAALESSSAVVRGECSQASATQSTALRAPAFDVPVPTALDLRGGRVPADVQAQCEAVCAEWCDIVDAAVRSADSQQRLISSSSGPLAEAEQWQRRSAILSSLQQQVKTKQCTATVNLLLAARSKVVQRWRAIEPVLQECAKVAEERASYLQSLKARFHALKEATTPVKMTKSALPQLIDAILKSKSTAALVQQHYIGVLMQRVSKQLARNCMSYLRLAAVDDDGCDIFWDAILATVRRREQREQPLAEDSPLKEIGEVLELWEWYRESLIKLCETLGAVTRRRLLPSIPSSAQVSPRHSRQTGSHTSMSSTFRPPGVASGIRKQTSAAAGPAEGLPLHKFEAILEPIGELAVRLRHIRQVVETLREFSALQVALRGLPEVVVSAEPDPAPAAPGDEDTSQQRQQWQRRSPPEETVTVACVAVSGRIRDLALPVSADPRCTLAGSFARNVCPTLGIPESSSEAASTRISSIVAVLVEDIIHRFSSSCPNAAAALNLHASAESSYDVVKEQFESSVGLLEQLLCNYVKLVFEWRLGKFELVEESDSDDSDGEVSAESVSIATVVAGGGEPGPSFTAMRALELLDRFKVVSKRPRLNTQLNELAAVAAQLFEEDLRRLRSHYERYKACAPVGWNSPPMTGTLIWIRQLLRRIQEPMAALKAYPPVVKALDFRGVVSLYNRLAKTVVTLEQMWMDKWEKSPSYLARYMKAPVLTVSTDAMDVSMDAGRQIAEFVREVTYGNGIGLALHPEMESLFRKRTRVMANYTELLGVLERYRHACMASPPEVSGLLDTHRIILGQNLKSGLKGTVTWNSTNIDTYLHCAAQGVRSIEDFSKRVCERTKVITENIQDIRKFCLFGRCHVPRTEAVSPDKFESAMAAAINGRFKLMRELVSKVEVSVRNLLSMSDLDCQAARETLLLMKMRPISARSQQLRDEVTRASRQYSIEEERSYQYTDIPPFEARILNKETVRTITAHYGALVTKALTDCLQESLSGYVHMMLVAKNCPLKIRAELWFAFPRFCVTPDFGVALSATKSTAAMLCKLPGHFTWFGVQFGITLARDRRDLLDPNCQKFNFLKDAEQGLADVLAGLEQYIHLWTSDEMEVLDKMHQEQATGQQYRAKVEEWHSVCIKIEQMAVEAPLSPVVLDMASVKMPLLTEAGYWRHAYARMLHSQVMSALERMNSGQGDRHRVMTATVQDIQSLRQVLNACSEVAKASLCLDEQISPIEETYRWMGEMGIHVPGEESEQLSQSRHAWQAMKSEAEDVSTSLLEVNREGCLLIIETERTDFETLLARMSNTHSASGPHMNFTSAESATTKLREFQVDFKLLDERRVAFNAVQEMFQMRRTPYPRLDEIGTELNILENFFPIYEMFGAFLDRFMDGLWSECDVKASYKEVDSFWKKLTKTVPHLKAIEWAVYRDTYDSLIKIRRMFPKLRLLAAKEMNSRHWIQVMECTNCSISLEADVLLVSEVIDIDLEKYGQVISDINKRAQTEMRLEKSLAKISEEWSEQVLEFSQYNDRGPLLLDKDHVQVLLRNAEGSQQLISNMLLTPEISPLRDDAAGWAARLAKLTEILEKWLIAQELWANLEAVFNRLRTKERAQFEAIDTTWCRMMAQSFLVKTVLLVCFAEDAPKDVFLQQFMADLERCQGSLEIYLREKREIFPRFYFVNDRSLLQILSDGSVDVVRPYLRMLFGSISSLKTEATDDDPTAAAGADCIVAVMSSDGDMLPLIESVRPGDETDQWLLALQRSVYHTLYRSASSIAPLTSHLPIEDYCLKFPLQVAMVGLHQQWTKDCHQAILDGRTDRQSLLAFKQKFSGQVSSVQSGLMRNGERGGDVLSNVMLQKLQGVLVFALSLLESIDDVIRKRVRDTNDFDWERYPRCYVQDPVAVDCAGSLPTVELGLLQHRIPYGGEYQGCSSFLGLTPLTDRSFVMLAQAMSTYQLSCLAGDGISTKTETIKMLARMCGVFMRSVACSSVLEPQALVKTISGCVQDGSWMCLQDIHLLQDLALQALASHMKTVVGALQAKARICTLPSGTSVRLNPRFTMMSTAALRNNLPWSPPGYLREQFRTVSVIKPDMFTALRSLCFAYGFKAWKMLGEKLAMFATFCHQQGHGSSDLEFSLTQLAEIVHNASERRSTALDCINSYLFALESRDNSQVNLNRDIAKPARSNRGLELLYSARVETLLIGEVLNLCLSSRLNSKDVAVFNNLRSHVFGTDKDKIISHAMELSRPYPYPVDAVMAAMQKVAAALNVTTEPAWLEQARVLYEHCYHFPGVLVTGDAGSGKSTLITVLVKSLDLLSEEGQEHGIGDALLGSVYNLLFSLRVRGRRRAVEVGEVRAVDDLAGHNGHRLVHLHHGAVSKPDMLLGCHDSVSRNWTDGVFTTYLRKAQTSSSMSWLWLDGPMSAHWMDVFSGLVSQDKALLLPTSEQVVVPEKCKLVCESCDISTAPPSFVANCGVVHVSCRLLTWKELVHVWLSARPTHESQPLLPVFDRVMVHLMKFIQRIDRPIFLQSNTGLVTSCLGLLTGLLDDMGSSSGEILDAAHMEKLLLFSVVNSYGAIVPHSSKFAFSQHLRGCSKILPDFERTPYTAFNYFVSDSGEWDLWSTWMDDVDKETSGPLDDIIVETVETIKTRFLLSMAETAKKDVLLVGPTAAGKSLLVNNYLNNIVLERERDPEAPEFLVRRLAFSSVTTSDHLQSFLEGSMEHRQGLTFGPPRQKKMVVFIDDINCSAMDHGSFQSANELLRQVAGTRNLLDFKSPGQVRTLEDVRFVAAATLPSDGHSFRMPQQLLRQFIVLRTPSYSEASRNVIVPALIRAALDTDGDFVDITVVDQLAKATGKLLQLLLQGLAPLPLPGREHYNFSLFDVVQIAKGLGRLNVQLQEDMELQPEDLHGGLYAMWRYESRSVVLSKVTRLVEETWAAEMIDRIAHTTFGANLAAGEDRIFLTLPMTHDEYETSVEATRPHISVRKESEKEDVRTFLLEAMTVDTQFEEYQDVLKGELAVFALEHIIQLHRCLSREGTSVVSVCPASHNNTSLVCLALLLSHHHVLDVVSDPPGAFFECLRTIFKLAVCDDQLCGVVIQEEQLANPVVLEAINSLISCGEVVGLFSSDEMDGLIETLYPILTGKYPQFLNCPQQFVLTKIRQNVRVVVTLQPDSLFVRSADRLCPALLYNCQSIWLHNWREGDLEDEARYTVVEQERIPKLDSELELPLVKALAGCHLLMLSYGTQCQWRGVLPTNGVPEQPPLQAQKKPATQGTTAQLQQPGRQQKPQQQQNQSRAVLRSVSTTLDPAVARVPRRSTHHLISKVVESNDDIVEEDDDANIGSTAPELLTSSSVMLERMHGRNYADGHLNKLTTEPGFLGSGEADLVTSPPPPKPQLPFVGPGTYRHFLAIFTKLYSDKVAHSAISRLQARLAMDTMQRTKASMDPVRAQARQRADELQGVELEVKKALALMTETSSLLEVLYAHLEIGKHNGGYLADVVTATDSRLRYLEDQHRQAVANRVMVDKAELVSGLERQIQALEVNMDAAADKRGKLTAALNEAKSKVLDMKSKIDRNTLERIRTLNSPPTLIGEVMEMIQETLKFYAPSASTAASSEPGSAMGSSISTAGSTTSSGGVGSNDPKTPTTPGLGLGLSLKRRQTAPLMQAKIDKDRWADIQLAIGDPQRFVDSLFAVPWEDELEPAILNLLESRLKPSSAGDGSCRDGPAPLTKRKSLVSQLTKGSSSKDDKLGSGEAEAMITVKKAKYASDDTAILTSYMLAIVNYQLALRPYLVACTELDALEKQLAELTVQRDVQSDKPEEASRSETPIVPAHRRLVETELEIERLERELAEFTDQYDAAVVKKDKLQTSVKELGESIATASMVTTWLADQEERWNVVAGRDTNTSASATNCLVLAAFLAYAAPLEPGWRHQLMNEVWELCKKHGLPEPESRVLKNCSYSEFILSKDCDSENDSDCFRRRHIQLMLPADSASQQIASMVVHGKLPGVPLLVDVHHAMQAWLQLFDTTKTCSIRHQDDGLHQMLEDCVLEGKTLVVLDVEPLALLEDFIMMQVLRRTYPLKETRKSPFGDRELNWHKSFRLILSTSIHLDAIPTRLFNEVIVLNASCEHGGTASLFGRRFVTLSKHRMSPMIERVNQGILETREKLAVLESRIVAIVSKCPDSYDILTLNIIRDNLAALKTVHDEATEKLAALLEEERSETSEDYNEISMATSTLFEALCSIGVLSPRMSIKLPMMLHILDSAIRDAESARASAVWSLFLARTVSYACGMLEELDQIALSFFVATELWQARERASNNRKVTVTALEKEFLFSPSSTAMNVISMTGNPPVINIQMPTSTVSRSLKEKLPLWKKPFDWLHEEQWHGIQLLATCMPWFIEPVEKMSRDGKEQQWRQLCETQFPHTFPLPDALDSKISVFQRLLVLRAVRPDRIVPAILDCAPKLVGSSFHHVPDFSLIPVFCPRRAPVLVLYDSEEGCPSVMIGALAKQHEVVLKSCTLAYSSLAMESELLQTVADCQAKGRWMFVEDIQCCPILAQRIATAALAATAVDVNFRLWFSAALDTLDSLPASLQAKCMPFLAKSPTTVSCGVQHNVSWLETALLGESTRREWVPTLHNACVLHAMFVLRSNIPLPSFTGSLKWNTLHFWEVLRWITQEFRSADCVLAQIGAGEHTRTVSWTALRYYIAEVIYGGNVTSTADLQRIYALVCAWISPSAASKEFELWKVGYKVPASAFSSCPSTTSLSKDLSSSLDTLPDAPETCYLHPTVEARPRYGLHILQRVSRLFEGFETRAVTANSPHVLGRRDKVLAGYTELSKVFRSPNRNAQAKLMTTPKMARPPLHKKVRHARPAGGKTIERDVVINTSQLFQSLRQPAPVNLGDFVTHLLTKVPRGWSPDSLRDRQSKTFKDSNAYRNFVLAEMRAVANVVNEVRTTLQAVKAATEASYPASDILTSKVLSAWQHLQQSRVPPEWCAVAGPASPPLTYSVVNWLKDLQDRQAQIERLLVLNRDKIAYYHLGMFSDPVALLSTVLLDSPRQYRGSSAPSDGRVLRAEVTNRDREHLREPAPDGIFVCGLHIWGVGWEKSGYDAGDYCPKFPPLSLPVVQIRAVPLDFSQAKDAVAQPGTTGGAAPPAMPQAGTPKPGGGGGAGTPSVFHCPVFHSQSGKSRGSVFTLELSKFEDRMPLRCAHCTLRAF